MTYKDILTDKGFIYNTNKELWIKNKGFGMSITVDHLMKGLFVVTTPQGVTHNGYVDNINEFKQIIEEL